MCLCVCVCVLQSAISMQSGKEDRKSAALKTVDEHRNDPEETETMVEAVDSGA